MSKLLSSSRNIGALWRNRAGAAALEFALALPMLLILLAGGYELSRAIWYHHLANKTVRDATRYVARMPDPLDPVTQARAMRLAKTGTLTSGAPALLPEWDTYPDRFQLSFAVKTYDNSSGTFRGPGGGNENIQVVQLVATVQFTGIGLLDLIGMPGGLTFTLSHEERHLSE